MLAKCQFRLNLRELFTDGYGVNLHLLLLFMDMCLKY